MNKKNVFYWTLYDFANSVVDVVFFLYFAQWLVVDKGVSDFWFNMTFVAGSALLLVTAPILGSLADRNGRQQNYLNRITILSFICFLGCSLITLFFSERVLLAGLFFMFAGYFYQFSFVFYNALLHYIAPREKWGYVSGLGQAGNWLGQIVGLLVTLPLASGAVYLAGEAGRAQTFLPATLLFLVLSAPMLLFFKIPRESKSTEKISWKEEYKSQWRQFKDLIRDPNMKFFLLGYFFFNDAIITASDNFPIFLQNVFSISDTAKSMLLVGILVTSVFGALASGWVSAKIGLKKTLLVVIGSWMILFPVLGIVTNFRVFIGAAVLMGFLFGSIWTVTRAVMTVLTPTDKLNFGFSFYTLAERASTFLGPVAWGLVTTLLVHKGPIRYRLAVISMAVFVAIGLYYANKVEIKEI